MYSSGNYGKVLGRKYQRDLAISCVIKKKEYYFILRNDLFPGSARRREKHIISTFWRQWTRRLLRRCDRGRRVCGLRRRRRSNFSRRRGGVWRIIVGRLFAITIRHSVRQILAKNTLTNQKNQTHPRVGCGRVRTSLIFMCCFVVAESSDVEEVGMLLFSV